ncbi:MAG: 4Fe-4S dicluster domain-containing protein [Calditrichaeota bacterium]|nr:MAG: 4Fe-4S dicluster domain-containing protein [Calditrichota bacterium]
MKIKRTIKYESELDQSFPVWVTSVPDGEKLRDCIQCGTCSGICPMSIYMDYTPRRIIAMAREGFKQEVLSSLTIWLCSSCYACTVNCPQEIKITDIMYAFKMRAIAEGIYPKRFPIPVLARQFAQMVKSTGRNTESRLVMKLIMKTSILNLLRLMPVGVKLFKSGRMPLKSDTVKNKREIKAMFKALEATS